MTNFKVAKLVALRKESVDRNRPGVPIPGPDGRSLSARRAWIEISGARALGGPRAVALRKESVDRNAAWTGVLRDMHQSLSARRAWIEISISKV